MTRTSPRRATRAFSGWPSTEERLGGFDVDLGGAQIAGDLEHTVRGGDEQDAEHEDDAERPLEDAAPAVHAGVAPAAVGVAPRHAVSAKRAPCTDQPPAATVPEALLEAAAPDATGYRQRRVMDDNTIPTIILCGGRGTRISEVHHARCPSRCCPSATGRCSGTS